MESLLGILSIICWVVAAGCSIWLAVIAARVAWWWCLIVIFGCGVGSIIFAVLHWDRAKRPFLIGLAAGILSGAFGLMASGGAIKSAMQEADRQTAQGESQLPAFDKELGEARKAAEQTATPTQPKPTPAVAPAEEALPFTPTARPKPFPYKDAPVARSAGVGSPATSPSTESTGESAGSAQVPVPPEAPPAPPKPRIEVVSAKLSREAGSGTIQIELNNAAPQAVTEVKLSLTYLDARGVRVGTWTTTRRGDPRLAPAASPGSFSELAIRMPSAARKVEVQVLEARLEDGTRIEY